MSSDRQIMGVDARGEIASHGSNRGKWGVAGCLLLAATLVIFMYRPSASSISSTLPWNLGDPVLNTWILAWESHSLVAEPARFFDGNIFHPFGEAIKYSEILLPLVPLFGLVSSLSGSPVIAHNVLILCLALFALVSTYLLARRLVGPWAATASAVSFTFSGYVFMHQGHIQLLTLGFFPLAYLLLFQALEKKRIRDGVWLGIVTALLTTGSVYYGAIWFVCLATAIAIEWFRNKKPDREWWSTVLAAGTVIAITVGPIAYVYAKFQSEVAFVREVGGLGINPIDFLTPAPGSVLYARLFEWAIARQPTGIVEHGFFLGFVVVGLAVLGLVQFVRRGRSTRDGMDRASRSHYELGLVATSGLVALILAVGPEALGLPMPFRLFQGLVPGFDDIREVSRLAVPALLAASIFAGSGLQGLLRGLDGAQRFVVVALVTSAILLEMWVEPLRAETDAPEPIRATLAAASMGAAIELPMRKVADPAFVFIEGPRLLASIGDWRPRFNGFSGGFPPGYFKAVANVMSFPDRDSLEQLADLEIRFVVLHEAEVASDQAFSFGQISEIIPDLPPDSSVVRVGDVWLVDLAPE